MKGGNLAATVGWLLKKIYRLMFENYPRITV